MVKQILPAITCIVFLSSCSAFKPLNFTSNRQVAATAPALTRNLNLLIDITVTPQVTADKTEVRPEPQIVSLTDTKYEYCRNTCP